MNDVFVLGMRDSLKMELLRHIAEGSVTLRVQLNGNAPQDMLGNILSEGSRMHVMGKFNLSESSDGGTLTVRPVASADTLRLYLSISDGCAPGGRLMIYRGVSKSVEVEMPAEPDICMIELAPNDERTVAVRIFRRSAGQNISETGSVAASQAELAETELAAIDAEKKLAELASLKASAKKRLEAVENEYNSDLDRYDAELAELRSRLSADEAVLEHYGDTDITPASELLEAIRSKLDEAETQIRFFIEARQKKTMEIEQQIKSGNKV